MPVHVSAVLALARAESVTENRNRYRDILKNQNRHRRVYWKKTRKKTKTDEKNTEKNENSVFADDDLLISSIFIFSR